MATSSMKIAARAINATLKLVWARLEDAVPEELQDAQDGHPAMLLVHLMLNALSSLLYSQLSNQQRTLALDIATMIGRRLASLLCQVSLATSPRTRREKLLAAKARRMTVKEEVTVSVGEGFVDQEREHRQSQVHAEHGTVINPVTGVSR